MGKELKRMRYFDGLLLNADDYILDQEYQRRLQQLHNRYLHTWGIVSGLEVKAVGDRKIKVTEGLALSHMEKEYEGCNKKLNYNDKENKTVKESISQEIYIYENHPDNPVDLKEYVSNDTTYIYVSYEEVNVDSYDIEKGKGKEIHILERSRICHSRQMPDDPKKDIILARVTPKKVDGKIVIDDSCINTDLRTYAGPAGKVLKLEKIVFNRSGDKKFMPFIRGINIGGVKEGLEVNSALTNFTGDVNINGNLVINGNLKVEADKKESEFLISNSYVQVNSPVNDSKKEAQDGGLEIYRGEGEKKNARLGWDEKLGRWKIGTVDDMHDIAYGEVWERLIKDEIIDDLHRHSKIVSTEGKGLTADDKGNLSLDTNINIKDKTLLFKTHDDINHGIGWYGDGKPFAGINVNGPVLFGLNGGILGIKEKIEKSVLTWNSMGNVGIGIDAPKDDKLEVAGSLRILSNSNPLRFTSTWTNFPEQDVNRAEICNDTTYHKSLMIVGNRSSGKERKVAIWDRLDVNGLLYINGNMQVSQALTPSAGNGNNGIIFPSDPGGGSGDSAWIKYYPVEGEACTLEIGTSNDSNHNISFMPSGNVGIGTLSPADKLDVNGEVRFLSNSNPLRFTSSWDPSNNDLRSSNYAEICNDTSKYKSLIIIGNKSSGNERRVSVWDNLDVNGMLKVTGDFKPSNAIVPSVGSSENNGIMFPKDPYGGSGDAAWIRYYSDPRRGGGENMTLEIGVSNDSGGGGYLSGGDHLRLYASGGVYVDGYFYYSSSKEYKENISPLDTQKARDVLEGLNPVTFNFKGDTAKTTMGFIAEEVPDAVAAYDKKAISPMEIVAVLTSVLKEQKKTIAKLEKELAIL